MKLIWTLMFALALAACGQKDPAVPGAVTAYLQVTPPQVAQVPAGKIEVLEFFSYGCIHCYRLNAAAKSWAAAQPADVVFRRVPVTFDRPQMLPLAKLFYTLESTGQMAALDQAVFAAIHDQGQNLATDEAVLNWVAGREVELSAFRAIYDSPETLDKVTKAVELTKAYKVSGTPALYVGGRFSVNNEAATSYENLMERTGKLVDKLRRGETP